MAENTENKTRTPSSHIDLEKAMKVRDGVLPANTPVGEYISAEGIFSTGFVHFEKDTGAARVSEKGKLRINWRLQTKRQLAALTAEDGTVVTAEQVLAYAKEKGLKV